MKALTPKFDKQKSFGNKAFVEENADGTIELYSYCTKVCSIKNRIPTFFKDWDCSKTTVRHVKEFLAQNGCFSGSTDEIRKVYKI